MTYRRKIRKTRDLPAWCSRKIRKSVNLGSKPDDPSRKKQKIEFGTQKNFRAFQNPTECRQNREQRIGGRGEIRRHTDAKGRCIRRGSRNRKNSGDVDKLPVKCAEKFSRIRQKLVANLFVCDKLSKTRLKKFEKKYFKKSTKKRNFQVKSQKMGVKIRQKFVLYRLQ